MIMESDISVKPESAVHPVNNNKFTLSKTKDSGLNNEKRNPPPKLIPTQVRHNIVTKKNELTRSLDLRLAPVDDQIYG